jgi:WD40 repeat protein
MNDGRPDDFIDIVARYSADFVGRRHLVEQVASLMNERNCRIVVLIGEPGVGKTAFLAHLASQHPEWLRYFTRRDSLSFLAPGDARTFLLTIGHQLAARRPELFRPEHLEVTIRQHIGALGVGGDVVGARIDELTASPFLTTPVIVEQHIDHVQGRATGVSIGHLNADARGHSVQDLQFLSLIYPLKLLAKVDPTARVVLLVDALDELRFSPTEHDLLRTLTELPELDTLSNLRIIATSRDEPLLARLIDRHDTRCLRFDVDTTDNDADLREYISRTVSEPTIQTFLSNAHITPAQLAKEQLRNAAGNFLYLKSVLGLLKSTIHSPSRHSQIPDLLRVDGVPGDLTALYGHFIRFIVRWCEDRFGTKAQVDFVVPLLCVLCVAQEPLTVDQLALCTGLSLQHIRQLLREFRQFVDIVGHETRRYQVYHSSFARFITDAATNDELWIDGRQAHARMADVCISEQRPDSQLHPYAIAHLITHLREAGQFVTMGEAIQDFGYLSRRLELYGSFGVDGVIRDHALALEIRHDLPSYDAIVARHAWFRRQAHKLRRGNSEWTANRILLQLASEEPPDTGIRQAADAWLAANRCDWVWLRSAEPPQRRHSQAVLEGHQAFVTGAVVCDDSRILSCSADGDLRLWDVPSTRCVGVFRGHRNWVLGCTTLTSDTSRRVLSWSADGTIRVWDIDALECQQVLEHRAPVMGARALNASSIVSWTLDGTIRLWDIDSGICAASFAVDPGSIRSVCIVHDAEIAIVTTRHVFVWNPITNGYYDLRRYVRHWDFETIYSGEVLDNRLVCSMDGRPVIFYDPCSSGAKGGFAVSAMADGFQAGDIGFLALPGDNFLSWAELDLEGKLWMRAGDPAAVNFLACFRRLKGHTRPITGASYHAEWGLVTWSRDNTIRLFTNLAPVAENFSGTDRHSVKVFVDESDSEQIWRGHTGEIKGARFISSHALASWGNDRTIRVWSRSGECLAVHDDLGAPIDQLEVVSPDYLVSWSYRERELRAWSAAPESVPDHGPSQCPTLGIMVLSDGRAAAWHDNNTISVWKPTTGECLNRLSGHSKRIKEVSELSDGQLLSIAQDKDIRVWDLSAGRCAARLTGRHLKGVSGSNELSPGIIASWGDDKNIFIWNITTSACIHTLAGHTNRILGLRKISGMLVSWSMDGSVLIWRMPDADTPERVAPARILSGHRRAVAGVVSYADRLISYSWDGDLRLWHEGASEAERVLRGHEGPVVGCIRLGHRAFSWSEDRTVRAWDLLDGKCDSVLTHKSQVVGSMVLSQRLLLTWCNDSTACVWDLETLALLEEIENCDARARALMRLQCRDEVASIQDAVDAPQDKACSDGRLAALGRAFGYGHEWIWSYGRLVDLWGSQLGRNDFGWVARESFEPQQQIAVVLPTDFGVLPDGRLLYVAANGQPAIYDPPTGLARAAVRPDVTAVPALRTDGSGDSSRAWSLSTTMIAYPAHARLVVLPCEQSKGGRARWETDKEVSVQAVLPTGIVAVTLASGEIHFIQLYRGATPLKN